MKFRTPLSFTILLALFPALLSANDLTNKTYTTLLYLQNYHYRQLSLDGTLARETQKTFLKTLDPVGLVFTSGDIKSLLAIPLDLNGLERAGMAPFFETALLRYQLRLRQTVHRIETRKELDLMKGGEYVLPDPDSTEPAANEEELTRRWESRLHFLTLQKIYWEARSRSEKPDLATLKERGKSALPAVKRGEIRRVRNILNPPEGFRNLMISLFVNSLVSQYDPHSRYVSAHEKQKIEATLSSTAFSFGFFVRQEMTGELRIDRIVPGGPAWKSGRLNRNDMLVRLTVPGRTTRTLEAVESDEGMVRELLNDPGVKNITVTVKKQNGRLETFSLIKERMEVEENVIDSFILDGREKIGYIYLPSFYTEWETPGIRGCASDVAREIVKLKRAGIDGLIIDLRGNGGGSLLEAQNLAGIFIDEGPMFVSTSPRNKARLLKDPSRGTIYDGPLAVLVDGQSASAPEFFASALKDHGRALIIGSRTFGKASSQVFIPLTRNPERIPQLMNSRDPHQDFIKITTHLYYNLSGRSHQAAGIEPHVPLPELFTGMTLREETLPHHLEAGSLSKKIRLPFHPTPPASKLARKSRSRVAKSQAFREALATSGELRKILKDTRKISLDPEEFVKTMDRIGELLERLEASVKTPSHRYRVKSTTFDRDLLNMDPYKKEMMESQKKGILEDIYLDEAFAIFLHYIKTID